MHQEAWYSVVSAYVAWVRDAASYSGLSAIIANGSLGKYEFIT